MLANSAANSGSGNACQVNTVLNCQLSHERRDVAGRRGCGRRSRSRSRGWRDEICRGYDSRGYDCRGYDWRGCHCRGCDGSGRDGRGSCDGLRSGRGGGRSNRLGLGNSFRRGGGRIWMDWRQSRRNY